LRKEGKKKFQLNLKMVPFPSKLTTNILRVTAVNLRPRGLVKVSM